MMGQRRDVILIVLWGGQTLGKENLRSLTWIKHVTDCTPSICNAHAYRLVSLHSKYF